jgi:uncharacterized peroxidase-related enzyme
MSWIRRIDYDRSEGELRALYDRVKGPAGNIDNVMKAHSLRPHTMEGHSALYKSVLHHTGNTLPVWLLEAIGVYTSLINKCDYSVAHHFAGLSRLLDDRARSDEIYRALAAGRPEDAFAGKELALLRYVAKLTRQVDAMDKADIAAARAAGADDGEIFEANQVSAYFAYSNRLLNGLGITTEGDVLGESPPETDDVTDWRHE